MATPDPQRRVAYLAIPHLPVAVERRERPRLARLPLIIAGGGAAGQVLDCSAEALALGVRPDMPLGQAERLCPEATCLPPRPDLYRQAGAALFELLSGQLPLVEQVRPGATYLGLDGLEQRNDDALTLCRQWGAAIDRELGLAAAAGVATGKFSAEVASLFGPGRVLVLSRGTERDFLSDFPVGLLPVSPETRRRLLLFGLRRLGQFAALPPAAVLAQFGWEGQRAHRLARGQDDRPLIPGPSQHGERAEQEFEPPLDNLEPLVATSQRLLAELARRLEPRFLRAGQISLDVTCADGTTLARQRLLAEPTADAGRLGRLAETWLCGLRYPGPVERLAVALDDLSAPSLHQLSFWQSQREAESDALLARLAARYGEDCFRRGVLVDPDHRLAGRRFVMTA